MFEDLDDPRPPVAGDTTRAQVAARIATRQARHRRRQRVALVGVLGAMIPVLAALVFASGRDSGDTQPATTGDTVTSTEVTAPPNPTTSSVPVSTTAPPAPSTTATAPAPAPVDHVADLDFLTAGRGYALGTADCDGTPCLQLRTTADGGATWAPLAAPAVSGDGAGTYQVRFGSTADGYIFGTTAYATHDGGATWESIADLTSVLAMEPEGDDVWALVKPCATGESCLPRLLASTDAGRTWSDTGWGAPAAATAGEVVRQSPLVGWVATSDLEQATATVSATTDGGSTWTRVSVPCVTPFTVSLTFVDTRTLWLACGADSGAGQQGKSVFRSVDGGSSWTQAADPPLSGFLANVASPAAGSAFVSMARNTLWATTDGGVSWHPAIPFDDANPRDGGTGPVRFVDPAHGWVGAQDAAGHGVVWRTADGGRTWTSTPVG